MSSLNRPPFSVTTWTILGRNIQTAGFKDAPWLAEAGEITKDKVRIDQSEATLSEITTPSHGDLAVSDAQHRRRDHPWSSLSGPNVDQLQKCRPLYSNGRPPRLTAKNRD